MVAYCGSNTRERPQNFMCIAWEHRYVGKMGDEHAAAQLSQQLSAGPGPMELHKVSGSSRLITPHTGNHGHHVNLRCIVAARCSRGLAHGAHPECEGRPVQGSIVLTSSRLWYSETSSAYSSALPPVSAPTRFLRWTVLRTEGPHPSIPNPHYKISFDSISTV